MAASLRLPRRVSKDEKKGIVDAIITELGLQKAANTRIGGGAGTKTCSFYYTGTLGYVTTRLQCTQAASAVLQAMPSHAG